MTHAIYPAPRKGLILFRLQFTHLLLGVVHSTDNLYTSSFHVRRKGGGDSTGNSLQNGSRALQCRKRKALEETGNKGGGKDNLQALPLSCPACKG
ncbi:hypothetical protein NPIL_485591 [Nephila pilipes]|uniref:Secreted protein n=1 Tax=Nephila pilipes TaxID=299642 RepID=A0A8X6NJS8_NEPPI|nr:hypothetical protein NPIL_485591 [Nephila pilipes]